MICSVGEIKGEGTERRPRPARDVTGRPNRAGEQVKVDEGSRTISQPLQHSPLGEVGACIGADQLWRR